METPRLSLPLPSRPSSREPLLPASVPPERRAEEACPPAGLGTWAATILVCLVAGASPIIGFLSFAN